MLRNFLFYIIFFSGIILISILFLPTLLMPQRIVLSGGKIMGQWAAICLNIIMSTKIEVIGKDNIVKNQKFFIAASHQSMFKTI